MHALGDSAQSASCVFVIIFDGFGLFILYFFSQLNKRWHSGVRWEIVVPWRLGADTQSCSWLVGHKTLDGKYRCFVCNAMQCNAMQCIGGGRDIDLDEDGVDHNTFPIISMAVEPLKWITVRHTLTLCKTHLILEYPKFLLLLVTKSVTWRYLGNQAWYHRSAGDKTTKIYSE